MSKAERIRRQQQLRCAQGYLELIMSGDDDVKLDTELLNRMADRGLQCLDELDDFFSIQGSENLQ